MKKRKTEFHRGDQKFAWEEFSQVLQLQLLCCLIFSCLPENQFAVLVWIRRVICLSWSCLVFCVHTLFFWVFLAFLYAILMHKFVSELDIWDSCLFSLLTLLVLSSWMSLEMELCTITCFMFSYLFNPHCSIWLLSLLLLLYLCCVWWVVWPGIWWKWMELCSCYQARRPPYWEWWDSSHYWVSQWKWRHGSSSCAHCFCLYPAWWDRHQWMILLLWYQREYH